MAANNRSFVDDEHENKIKQSNEELNITVLRDLSENSINGSLESNNKQQHGDRILPIKILVDGVQWFGNSTSSFHNEHRKAVRYMGIAVLNIVILAYFFIALSYWYRNNVLEEWKFCSGFGFLVVIYSISYYLVAYYMIIRPFFGRAIYKAVLSPISRFLRYVWSSWIGKIIVTGLMLSIFLIVTILDTVDSRYRFTSLGGYVIILTVGFIFSKAPGKVNWKPVFWGIILHWVMGFLTIRWKVGRSIFQCMGDKINTFQIYGLEGSTFVFGEYLVVEKAIFAFKVLPVIFFYGTVIEVLFHWGVMQWIFLKFGWFLQVLLGTTVCESIMVSANIFLGGSESPLLIKPYIPDLTKSEIHAIMTSGFATVSGSVMAAYISFGVNPAYLITASVMAAPATLCFAKLFCPEVEESKTDVDNIQTITTHHSSVLAAATSGASSAIPLVLNIAANLVAFMSVVAFLNGILLWLGILVGVDFLSFEWIIGKIFWPVSFVLGVPWSECELVGNLIGLKTVVNEFVAYRKLGQYKDEGLLSPRSEAIATYALCSFANPSSLAVLIGALTSFAPSKKSDVAEVAVRSFLSGCAVCFMSACIAVKGSFIKIMTSGNLFPPSSLVITIDETPVHPFTPIHLGGSSGVITESEQM